MIPLVKYNIVLKSKRARGITAPATSRFSAVDVEVDTSSRDVWVQGAKVDPPLSNREFNLLNLLYERIGETCSKFEIAARTWPERQQAEVRDDEIDRYVDRLRSRIEEDPAQPRYILAVRRYGYRLVLT